MPFITCLLNPVLTNNISIRLSMRDSLWKQDGDKNVIDMIQLISVHDVIFFRFKEKRVVIVIVVSGDKRKCRSWCHLRFSFVGTLQIIREWHSWVPCLLVCLFPFERNFSCTITRDEVTKSFMPSSFVTLFTFQNCSEKIDSPVVRFFLYLLSHDLLPNTRFPFDMQMNWICGILWSRKTEAK
jgi:hypothetical protein